MPLHASRRTATALSDFPVGEPIPFSIYDRHGNLLLRKGFVINNERQRDRLLQHGLFQHDPGEESANGEAEFNAASQRFTVFETLEVLLSRLDHAYQLLAGPDRHRAPYELLRIALDIQAVCADNADAVMGAMQVSHDLPYGLIHPLHCAVICELLAVRLGMPQLQRLPLVAGAASHDLGIWGLQERLHRQTEPLSESQWQQIRRHPLESRALLEKAGVDDPVWLAVVAEHHERLDGSGYPKGTHGGQLRLETRILAIADIYTAMIRPRAYRDAHVAQEALRSLFQARGATVDPQLIKLFVKEVGLFPPGAFVRLRNGEIAVIQKRGDDPAAPVLFSLQTADGTPMSQLRQRDPGQNPYAIVEMLPHHDHPSLRSHLNELWPPLHPIALH